MNISAFGSVSSPGGEDVSKIIDGNISTKFLDFNFSDGMGFTVYMGGSAYLATSIEITTANDSPNRDPRNYELLGSNDGSSFNSVTSGSIPCVSSRFSKRTFSFSNTIPYKYYRIIFTNQCGADNSIQIAETQLIGTINEAPVAICKNFTAQLGQDGTVSINPADVDNGSSDAEGDITLSLSENAFNCSNIGDNSITLTVTDSAGLTDSCTATVTIEDSTAPAVVTQNVTVSLDENGQAEITPDQINNNSTDNCGIDLVEFSSGTAYAEIIEGQMLSIALPAGQVVESVEFASYGTPTGSNGSYSIGTCHASNSKSIVESYALGKNSFSIPSNNSVFGDPCGGTRKRLYVAVKYGSYQNFTCENIGENIVSLKVTDKNGNSSEATATVTVEDKMAPTAIAKNISLELDENGVASITPDMIDNGSSDNCGVNEMSLSQSAFSCADVSVYPSKYSIQLGDSNDYILAADASGMIAGKSSFTLEGWVNSEVFGNYKGIMGFRNDADADLYLLKLPNNTIEARFRNEAGNVFNINAGILPVNEWHHLAFTYDGAAIKLYEDGALIGSTPASGKFKMSSTEDFYIGAAPSGAGFFKHNGKIEDVRLWDVARSQAEIEANLTTSIVSAEPGLVMNYTLEEGPSNSVVSDLSGNSPDGVFKNIDASTAWVEDSPTTVLGANEILFTVKDANGNESSVSAYVTLEDKIAPTVKTQDITVQLDENGVASITPDMVDNNSSDACGIENLSLDVNEFSCADIGENTVTLTVADKSGNTSEATATVTVEDNTAPQAIAKNITVALDENGTASITPEMVNNGSSDNCTATEDLQLSLDKSIFSCEDVVDKGVTPNLSALNFDGNDYVSIPDSPELQLKGNMTLEAWFKVDEFTGDWVRVVGKGAGPAGPVGPRNYGLWYLPNGTWLFQQYGDGVELAFNRPINIGEWYHFAAVKTGNLAKLYINGEVVASNTAGTNPVTSNDPLTIGYAGFHDHHIGQIDEVRLWNIARTDEEILNNYARTLDPVTPGLLTYYNMEEAAGNVLNDQTANGFNGDLQEFSQSEVWTGSSRSLGPVSTILTVTDVNGNKSTATATVTVEDNIAAEVLIQDITVELDVNGMASIAVEDIDNGSSDNCEIESLELDVTEFTCVNVGANTVTLTATDVNGNISSATATVTVEDNIAAEVLTQDITIELDVNGMVSIAVEDIDNGSSDNCEIESLELDVTEFTCVNVGANTVTLTATDVNGNVSSATATVTVEDNIAAEVLTQDITVELDANGMASIAVEDIDNGSNDACGIESMELDVTEFNCANVGANTVTLTATDVNGNISSATATVTVEDNIAAEVLTQDITVELDVNGMAVISVEDIDNSSSDNCEIESLELDVNEFSCKNVGANTVTLTATDVNGNISSATAMVTVEDNIAAEVVTQDITVELDANGMASIAVEDIDNGSNDACGIESMELDVTEFTCANVGANTVTLSVTDVNGNVSSATATVTVEDNIAPIVITKNISIELDEMGMASIIALDVDNGSADACGIEGLSLDLTDFTCEDIGENTVLLTVKDVNGNESSATAIVNVEDKIAPAPVMDNLDPIYAECAVERSDVPTPLATDNCDVEVSATPDLYFPVTRKGSTFITWKYEDDHGNVTYQQQEIIIEDTTAPVADVAELEDIMVECGISDIPVPTATDNCRGTISATTQDPLNYMEQGEYTITWTYDDENGNITTQQQNVIVRDVTAPEVITRDITIYLDPRDNVYITTEDIDDGTSDNCSEVNLSLDQTYFERQGIYEVTLSATDMAGNTSSATAEVTVEIDAVDTKDAHVVPTLLKRDSKANVILPFRSRIASVEVIETETNKFKSFEGNKKNKMEIDVAPFKGTLLVRIVDTDANVYLKKLVAF
ncbi:hypothetical protein GCM10023115_28610 [Pontixanthobacter gangjinensis]